jgi:hypothetical protein
MEKAPLASMAWWRISRADEYSLERISWLALEMNMMLNKD